MEVQEQYLLVKVAQIPKNISIIKKNRDIYNKNEEPELEPPQRKEKKKELPTLLSSLDSFEYKVSVFLRDEILEVLPNQRIPKTLEQLQEWAKIIK